MNEGFAGVFETVSDHALIRERETETCTWYVYVCVYSFAAHYYI